MIDTKLLIQQWTQNPAYDLPFIMIEIIEPLRNVLELYQNEVQAVKMSAYLRNKFAFYGIQTPIRRNIFHEWKKHIPKDLTFEQRWGLVFQLWNSDKREMHYMAVDWINSWNKSVYTHEDIKNVKLLIETNSWWDSVDLIASNFVTNYFKKFPEMIVPIIEEWSVTTNFWLHRSTLIFQLKYKHQTDLELLEKQINRFKNNNEFFIQKAIGWSLREVSKVNPLWTRNAIQRLEIKGLAKREASKHLQEL